MTANYKPFSGTVTFLTEEIISHSFYSRISGSVYGLTADDILERERFPQYLMRSSSILARVRSRPPQPTREW